jgi:hypothetical protein
MNIKDVRETALNPSRKRSKKKRERTGKGKKETKYF